jgi:RNA polymerase sigma-70 factor (family 1)
LFSNEKILIERVIKGDHVAYTTLYKKYQPIVLRFIYTFLKSPEISNDVCQEVFIKLWELRHKLTEVNSFKAYLFTIAKNHTLNTLKRAAVDHNLKSRVIYNFVEGRNEVEDEILSEEYYNYIHSILQTLPKASREMFKLCRIQGKTYDEAAKALGLSRNTVKKHMVSSMKVLKLAVQKDLGIFFVLLVTMNWITFMLDF